jgi:hypothetical protein
VMCGKTIYFVFVSALYVLVSEFDQGIFQASILCKGAFVSFIFCEKVVKG